MKIMICTTHFPHCAEMLRQSSCRMTLLLPCPAEEVVKRSAEMDVLVPAMYRVDAEVIANTSAKLINQFGVGIEGVDIPSRNPAGYLCRQCSRPRRGGQCRICRRTCDLSDARPGPPISARRERIIQQRVLGAPSGQPR